MSVYSKIMSTLHCLPELRGKWKHYRNNCTQYRGLARWRRIAHLESRILQRDPGAVNALHQAVHRAVESRNIQIEHFIDQLRVRI